MSVEILNRRAMADRLESVMTSSYNTLKEELRLGRNLSLLKTYLLEAHASTSPTHSELLSFIEKTFSTESSRRRRIEAAIQETQDENLFTVTGVLGRDRFVFYIDTTDSRFWIAHSISKSDTSDLTIQTILDRNTRLDSMWMPMELLARILHFGVSRGLALDFDRRYLDKTTARRPKNIISSSDERPPEREVGPISMGDHLEYVKMQLWGEGADRIIEALRAANLTNSTTISKVRLKTQDEDDEDLFSLADVKFDGKVTGRGTSFDIYNSLLLEVLQRYSTAIRSAEDRFRIHWQAGGQTAHAVGEPFYITLGEHGVSNLEQFCARLFSGGEPFRLMGLPIRRNLNYYTVSAVDLHINQRVDFEVSRKTLSVFLPKTACGNSLLRLYTNLQHYFSSDVKAIDGSGSEVFAF